MTDKNGWIKLYRKIQDNILWQDKPFSKGQAWIDLLMQVNHKENKILFGNEALKVAAGEKITSIRKLCDRWGWSNTKVKNFLELLTEEKMITYKSDTKKTVIKVLNYSKYQHSGNGKNDSKTSLKHIKNDSKTSLKHTNKNVKNLKNDKECKELNNSCSDSKDQNPNPKFDNDSMPYKAAAYLRKLILENNNREPVPDETTKDLEDWAVELDRLNRLGPPGAKNKGYNWKEIGKIMEWCQDDSFWKKNIKSASKFRKQITKLEDNMKINNSSTKKEDKQDEAIRNLYQKYKEEENNAKK